MILAATPNPLIPPMGVVGLLSFAGVVGSEDSIREGGGAIAAPLAAIEERPNG